MRSLVAMRLLAAVVTISLLAIGACSSAQDTPEATTPLRSGSATPRVSVPQKPDDFDSMISVLAQYLTDSRGSSSCLAELFALWHMPSDATVPCASGDFDGDGEEEYVVRLTREVPEGGVVFVEGKVAIFHRVGEFYEPITDVRDVPPAARQPREEARANISPSIFDVGDFNDDSRAEAAVMGSNCGAHTCTVGLSILGFESGSYLSIIRGEGVPPSPYASAFLAENQVWFEDTDDDGHRDLMVRQGVVNSAGAGPQREATRTYRWDGERYTFAETKYDFSSLRYFKVRDADEAFVRGDYREAIALYENAIENAALEEVESFGSKEELVAYSGLRAGLAYIQFGDAKKASDIIEETIDNYPVSLHGKAALAFRNAADLVQIGVRGSTTSGCAAVREFLMQDVSRFSEVWNYGYANPAPTPEGVCPF